MEEYVKCEYLSIIFKDDTVSDYTNCHLGDHKDGIKIITSDNNRIFYYGDSLKGFLYKPVELFRKNPLTD